jgi:TolA-binding protein
MNPMTFKSLSLGILATIAFPATAILIHTAVNAQEVEPILDTSRAMVQATGQTQERIEQLDSRTQSLLSDYRANLKQLEQLNRYNASQQRQVDAQRREMDSLTNDINNIASLQRSIQPLMEDMVEALDQLIEADLPFLLDERRARVERLSALMDDPSRSPAQRYRLVVEAYQIENEYGRTIEAYRGDIEAAGRQFENVEFLRIGRTSLTFRTDDDQTLMRFDPDSRQWVELDLSFLPDIKMGSRIAREQIPPDLMFIPVRAPQTENGG